MEFKAELKTNLGMALMARFRDAVGRMEHEIASAEAEVSQVQALYEHAVDDRAKLRMMVKERDELLKELYDLAAMGEFDVGEEFRFHEILTGMGLEV